MTLWYVFGCYAVMAVFVSTVVLPLTVRRTVRGDMEATQAERDMLGEWGTEHFVLVGSLWPVLLTLFVGLKINKLGRWLFRRKRSL